MKTIFYPEEDGAENIIGWVNKNGTRYDFKVGETVEIEDEDVDVLKYTFPFLELSSEVIKNKIPEEVKKVIEEKKIKDVDKKIEDIKKIVDGKFVCKDCGRICRSEGGLLAHKRFCKIIKEKEE